MSRTSKKPGAETRVPDKPGCETQAPGKPWSPVIGSQEADLRFLGGEAGPRRRGGKPGRKPASKKLAAPRRSRRKLPPGRGAERLRSSVNVILNDESDLIARALVDKTIAGNMTSARLLVELSGAKHPPTEPENDWDHPSLAESLATEPEWVDPDPPDPSERFPGEPLFSFQERMRLLPAPKPESQCESEDSDAPEA